MLASMSVFEKYFPSLDMSKFFAFVSDEMWKYAVYLADATSHSSFVIVNFSG
jgi:hypothetical protein